jgi:hypothetical protein
LPSEVRKAAAELDDRVDGGVRQLRRGDRLSSLAAALEAYQARLGALGALDRPAALRAAADTLARGALSEEVRDLDLLVLDGFHALSAAAFDLVAALAHRARRVHVRVPYFPERPEISAPAEQLLRRLEGLHELSAHREVTVALEHLDAGGERAPRLARVLRALAGGPGAVPDDSAGLAPQGARGEGSAAVSIGLVLGAVGAGEEGDAEVGARLAAELLERGFGAEEIIVLAPSPARLAPRLARACAELGVPFASGRGLPLAELPPVRAARDALAAAVQPSRAALEAAIASPYLGLTRAPARLGFWLDRSGAIDGRGDPEQALRRRAAALRSPAAAPERAALLRSAAALAALRSALHPLGAPGLPREHAARLSAIAIGPGSGARRRAARAEPELARRDLAALARLEEVAGGLAGALGLLGRGDEALSAERWRSLFELALDGAVAPPPPEPAAGAVELWPLAEAPGLAARAAIVLGCARGRFPPSPPPEPLLRDAERAALNRAACRAAVTSGSMGRAEALHVAFCAFAAGREALALTWPGAGPEGDGNGPAPLAVEALVAAGVEVPAAPARDPDLAGSRSAAEELRAVARAVRDGAADAVSGPIARSMELRARAASVFARGAMEAERCQAVLARRASPVAGALPEALLPELSRALPAEWSPSLLETHARCPFRLFAGLVLGLADPDTADLDIDPRDEGKLTHAIMERFLRSRLASGGLPLRGAPEEREGLRAVAAALFSGFEADGRTGDPAAWSGRRAAVLSRLERVIEAEGAQGAEANGPNGVVAPTLLEYRFGGDSGVPPLVFPDDSGPGGPGREVRLRGRLDRVDASPERLVLIDYKDSRARADWKEKLELDALGETNFQVPAYLMAASRALPGRAHLEATYLLLRSAERVGPFRAEADDPLFAVDEAARAVARDAGADPFADAVVAAVRRIRAGVLPIASRDCTGCAFGAVCRFQSLAEGPP